MMRGILALIVLVLVGCGSESRADPVGSGHGPCAQRAGTYAARYTERQGTCGPVQERVSSLTVQPQTADVIDAGCTGSIAYTPDNCEVTYASACPEDGIEKGGSLTTNGNSKWNASADHGTAVEQWTIRGPAGQTRCLSTYDVTITKQ